MSVAKSRKTQCLGWTKRHPDSSLEVEPVPRNEGREGKREELSVSGRQPESGNGQPEKHIKTLYKKMKQQASNFDLNSILTGLLLILPFILIAIYWDQLPDKIPIHIDINGEIDRYSESKAGIFLLPVINVLTFLLLIAVPFIDPKKKIAQFAKTYDKLKLILIAFLTVLFLAFFSMALGYKTVHLAEYIILFFFMILGNYMSKMRPNYFIGVRTPWTLESEEVWIKTHRLTAYLWTLASLIMLVLRFLIPGKSFGPLLIVYIIVIALVPIIYSYVLYKGLDSDNDNTTKSG